MRIKVKDLAIMDCHILQYYSVAYYGDLGFSKLKLMSNKEEASLGLRRESSSILITKTRCK